MNKQITLYALLLVFSSFFYLYAQEKEDVFFFIQLTDPQFGFIDENKSIEPEMELYSKAIEKINRLSPDLLIITGDMVNKKHDELQNSAFIALTRKIDPSIPVYFIPGNHDIGENPELKNIQRYKQLYGEDRFSFTHKDCAFIGINSVVIKSAKTRKMEEEQFRWLSEELDKYPDVKQKFIFTHYPFFIKKFEEEEKYSNLSKEAREKYFELFLQKNISAIFAGHYHNNGYGEHEGIPMITTSALGKPLSNAPSGLRIIKVFSDKIEHTYYPVDDIPDKLD